ncbi:hypothetical protein HI914_00211 [Erysiphe necator]|nr:hypothetical protein HI914_00211 [Erysiphe necator]
MTITSNVKDFPIHTKRVPRSMSSLSKSDTSKQNDNLPLLNSDIKRLTIDKSCDNHLFTKNLLDTSSQKPLYSFLHDLFSDHLFQAQTAMSLNSEIEFLHQQQISLEKNRSSVQDLKIIMQHKE